MLEESLGEMHERLAELDGAAASLEGADKGGDDMHPALAPLYYLYGTTLLYLVEESDVMMNGKVGSCLRWRLQMMSWLRRTICCDC